MNESLQEILFDVATRLEIIEYKILKMEGVKQYEIHR